MEDATNNNLMPCNFNREADGEQLHWYDYENGIGTGHSN